MGYVQQLAMTLQEIHESISWANLQWPPDGSICPSGSFNAFGQIFIDNVTQGAGAGQNITAEIGYSTSKHKSKHMDGLDYSTIFK